MKTIEEELGKVSLTCNGQWNDRPYERLTLPSSSSIVFIHSLGLLNS